MSYQKIVEEKDFGFIQTDNIKIDSTEIAVIKNSDDARGKLFVISNSKKIPHIIYAPEINFYLKNSQDSPEEKSKNILTLYKIRHLKYIYSTDIPQSKKISNKLLIVGKRKQIESFKNTIENEEIFEILETEAESVKSIKGTIGELEVETSDQKPIIVDQIIWFDLPEYFERVGIYDPNKSSKNDVMATIQENLYKGYQYKKIIQYDPSICQYHERKYNVCGFCADICPTGAILKIDDKKHLEFTQINCTGCGGCVSICPSGALDYRESNRNVFHLMSKSFRNRIPLIIPESLNIEKLDIKLKKGILPFVVGGRKFLDESHFITLIQESGSQVILFNDSISKGTGEAIDIVNEIYIRKYGKKGVLLTQDLNTLKQAINEACPIEGSQYRISNQLYKTKREIFSERLKKLIDSEDLGTYNTKEYIHYGKVRIDKNKCTLCLSCAGGCNVKALKPDPSDNTLRFNASICTNCGYCAEICPEDCLEIVSDVIEFKPSYFDYETMAKDELFRCIECGKPFAPTKSINKVAEAMIKIWGRDDPRVKTLFCCPDCKPKVMFKTSQKERKY